MSELTNTELRLAVAKAKGWTDTGVMNDGAHEFWGPDGNYCYIDGRHFEPVLPNWPDDIAAAWELVEDVSKVQAIEVGCWKKQILVRIYYVGYPDVVEFRSDADTAARAICLAYLQFVQERAK